MLTEIGDLLLFPARVFTHCNVGGVNPQNRLAITWFVDNAYVLWAERYDLELWLNGPRALRGEFPPTELPALFSPKPKELASTQYHLERARRQRKGQLEDE